MEKGELFIIRIEGVTEASGRYELLDIHPEHGACFISDDGRCIFIDRLKEKSHDLS